MKGLSYMFNHILVAFDGSDSAKLGLSMGLNFCKSKENSLLSVVYVYEENNEGLIPENTFVASTNSTFYADSSQGQAIVPETNSLINNNSANNNRLEEIERYVNSLEGNNLIHSHFVVLEGTIDDMILQYAEKEGVDLIIVGNSSTTGLRKLFLGSISEKIIKNASCPVLVAK